jgi:outer membrane protein, heavy metal efflux system
MVLRATRAAHPARGRSSSAAVRVSPTVGRVWVAPLARAALSAVVARRFAFGVVCGAALLGTARAQAEEVSGVSSKKTSELTFSAALAAAAQRGPIVLEASHQHAAAQAFAREPASSLPALPQLTVLAGARRPYNLPTGPEVVLSVQQELATGKLGEARRRAAEWSARATGSELARVRLEAATMAALAWLALREAQDLAAVRHEARADAVRLLQIAEERVKGGAATAVERSLAEAEVGSARLAELDAEGKETEARLALAYATSAPLDSALVAAGTAQIPGTAAGEPGEPLDVDTRGPRTETHPALRAAEAQAERLAHEGTVNRVLLGPMISVGGSVWREGSGDRAAAAVVTVPLPFFDPARYESQRQALAVTSARAYATRLRGELEREARLAAHDQEHSREVVAELRGGVLTPLRRAVETSMIAYRAGTMELGLVLLARRSALGAAERLVSATAEVARADVHAAALSGALVPEERR